MSMSETGSADVRVDQRLYLYGMVMPNARLPDDLTGVQGRPVQTERLEHVTVLVSDVGGQPVGLPAEIRAHAAVLDAVARACPVLPVQFGATVHDVDELRSVVSADRERAYLEGLRELADVVQLSVAARYHQEAIITELVEEDPDIRRLRELTCGRPEEAAYDQRVRLGELVVRGFDRKRAADGERLERAILPLVRALKLRELTQVDTVLEAAMLVRRDAVAGFEEALEGMAAGLAGRVSLRLVGPQAPYDFVEVV